MPGDMWQQFANLRLLYGYQYGHPAKKLLSWPEFAQAANSAKRAASIAPASVRFRIVAFSAWVADLNKLYGCGALPATKWISTGALRWIDCNDADNSVFSSMRRGKNPQDLMIVVLNATPVVRPGYRVGVPQPGFYKKRSTPTPPSTAAPT